jgi:hypothetical protein
MSNNPSSSSSSEDEPESPKRKKKGKKKVEHGFTGMCFMARDKEESEDDLESEVSYLRRT